MLADLEQDPLRPVDGDLGVVGLLVADRRDPPGGGDQVAQHRLALDDAAVVLDVDRRRHRVHQAGQVGRPAHRLQPIAPRQLVAQGDEVDGLALAVQAEHRLVDVGVLLAIEVGRPQEVGDLQDSVRIDEDRAEHALLGFDARGDSLSMLTDISVQTRAMTGSRPVANLRRRETASDEVVRRLEPTYQQPRNVVGDNRPEAVDCAFTRGSAAWRQSRPAV